MKVPAVPKDASYGWNVLYNVRKELIWESWLDAVTSRPRRWIHEVPTEQASAAQANDYIEESLPSVESSCTIVRLCGRGTLQTLPWIDVVKRLRYRRFQPTRPSITFQALGRRGNLATNGFLIQRSTHLGSWFHQWIPWVPSKVERGPSNEIVC